LHLINGPGENGPGKNRQMMKFAQMNVAIFARPVTVTAKYHVQIYQTDRPTNFCLRLFTFCSASNIQFSPWCLTVKQGAI
jgi:hypothetical protein